MKKLLFIDDDPLILRTFNRFFKEEYTLYLCETGEEGIQILKKENVAIIICDIILPGIDGINFLRLGLCGHGIIDLRQQRFNRVLGGRGIEGDGGGFGIGTGLNRIHTGQITNFQLDGVDTVPARDIWDIEGYSCHGLLLWFENRLETKIANY